MAIMTNEFEKNSKAFWEEILSRKKSLTDEEADDIEDIVREMRKETKKDYNIK